ncbi:hypothetical protein Tco_0040877 [Tanacetum coccineum]
MKGLHCLHRLHIITIMLSLVVFTLSATSYPWHLYCYQSSQFEAGIVVVGHVSVGQTCSYSCVDAENSLVMILQDQLYQLYMMATMGQAATMYFLDKSAVCRFKNLYGEHHHVLFLIFIKQPAMNGVISGRDVVIVVAFSVVGEVVSSDDAGFVDEPSVKGNAYPVLLYDVIYHSLDLCHFRFRRRLNLSENELLVLQLQRPFPCPLLHAVWKFV